MSLSKDQELCSPHICYIDPFSKCAPSPSPQGLVVSLCNYTAESIYTLHKYFKYLYFTVNANYDDSQSNPITEEGSFSADKDPPELCCH